jgi:predicted nucleic acid-binding Zn ribbon protein
MPCRRLPKSTSDDTLIICPACGANLGRWGDAKSEIGKAAAKTIVDEMLKGTGFKLE